MVGAAAGKRLSWEIGKKDWVGLGRAGQGRAGLGMAGQGWVGLAVASRLSSSH